MRLVYPGRASSRCRRAAAARPGAVAAPATAANPHGLSASALTGRCVYQSRHPGTRIRAGDLAAATRSVKPLATSRTQSGGILNTVVINSPQNGADLCSIAGAIGHAHPVSVFLETFGTGDQERAEAFVRRFDFRPASIINKLDLLRPIYRRTTNYGHFGRPGLPWEM